MNKLTKKLIEKATEFSRRVDLPNVKMMVGLSHEYMARTVPEDYSKIKVLQRTKQPDPEYRDVKSNT